MTTEFERLHGIPFGRTGSQGGEEEVILAYFGDRVGAFLDIGAFDGITISNTFALSQRGWIGTAVEPDPQALKRLLCTHGGNRKISIIAAAVTDVDGVVKFHNSNGGAVSTTSASHRDQWATVARFETIEVPSITVKTLLKVNPGPYQMLSVDVEGESVQLFEKFPLREMGVELAVVEHDGMHKRVMEHALAHGLTRELYRSAENMIVAKP